MGSYAQLLMTAAGALINHVPARASGMRESTARGRCVCALGSLSVQDNKPLGRRYSGFGMR